MWFWLALGTAVLWAAVNIFDKVLVTKYTKNPLLATILVNLMALPLLVGPVFILGFPLLEFNILLIFSLSVGLSLAAILLYFKALQEGEASRVMVAFNTMPLFTLFLAVFLLGETLTSEQCLGVFFLIVGAMLVSVKKKKFFGLRKWLAFVLLSALLFAADTIIHKFLLEFTGWWSLIFWRAILLNLLFLPLVLIKFKELKSIIVKKPKALLLALANEALYLPGRSLLLISLTIGTASLVTAITALQPFFVLLLAITSTKLFPAFLKEKIGIQHIAMKIIAVVFAVTGAILVS